MSPAQVPRRSGSSSEIGPSDGADRAEAGARDGEGVPLMRECDFDAWSDAPIVTSHSSGSALGVQPVQVTWLWAAGAAVRTTMEPSW